MFLSIHEIKIIKLNQECWENSTCTCKEHLKFLKCNHVISLATRLNLCTFKTVAYSIPLAHKRKRGKPANTFSALQRQPDEFQSAPQIELCSEVQVPLEVVAVIPVIAQVLPVIKCQESEEGLRICLL